jgi:hypothetical protein
MRRAAGGTAHRRLKQKAPDRLIQPWMTESTGRCCCQRWACSRWCRSGSRSRRSRAAAKPRSPPRIPHKERPRPQTCGERAPHQPDAVSASTREEQIRQRAFQIWLDEGKPDGREQEHWAKAKAQIGE